VLKESASNLIQPTELETIVAILRKRVEQVKVMLPKDVAFDIAQNVRSNARTVDLGLNRLMAHSSVNSTGISLTYAQRVLENFIDSQARQATVDLFQKPLSQQFATEEGEIRRQNCTSPDKDLGFCLLQVREGRKTTRVRHELEVNMRERERERLARRDVYERELECRTQKRKQA
jgi:hypothetical protein